MACCDCWGACKTHHDRRDRRSSREAPVASGELIRRNGEPPGGVQVLRDPRLDKGTAFTQAERQLQGLLPRRPRHWSVGSLPCAQPCSNESLPDAAEYVPGPDLIEQPSLREHRARLRLRAPNDQASAATVTTDRQEPDQLERADIEFGESLQSQNQHARHVAQHLEQCLQGGHLVGHKEAVRQCTLIGRRPQGCGPETNRPCTPGRCSISWLPPEAAAACELLPPI